MICDDCGAPCLKPWCSCGWIDREAMGERLLAACQAVGGFDPENPDGWTDFASEVAADLARDEQRS